MATRRARGGIDHPTVVPENFEPGDEEGEQSGNHTDETSPSDARRED